MNSRCRPRRSPRMTLSHKNVFVNWIESHPDNIRLLKGGPPLAKQWREKKWVEIAKILNASSSTTPPKSVDKWRKSILDLRSKLRKKRRLGIRLVDSEGYIMKLMEAPLAVCTEKLQDPADDDNTNESSNGNCSEDNKEIKYDDILFMTEPEVTSPLENYLTEAVEEPESETTAEKNDLNSAILVINANRQTAAMESIAKSLAELTKQSAQTNQVMVKCVETLSSLVEVLANKNPS